MKRMTLLMILFAQICFAQRGPQYLKPVLAGILVKNLDSSIQFYSKYLAFSVKERKDYPDYDLRIAFLQNNGYELELVENKKAIVRAKILTENKATDITGIAKLTFEVSDIRQLYDELKIPGITIVQTLRESNRNISFLTFILTDPDKNWIQFVGKK